VRVTVQLPALAYASGGRARSEIWCASVRPSSNACLWLSQASRLRAGANRPRRQPSKPGSRSRYRPKRGRRERARSDSAAAPRLSRTSVVRLDLENNHSLPRDPDRVPEPAPPLGSVPPNPHRAFGSDRLHRHHMRLLADGAWTTPRRTSGANPGQDDAAGSSRQNGPRTSRWLSRPRDKRP
jgi:hypothetical protein